MPKLELSIVQNRGVKFINDYLQVWFNFVPDPDNDGRGWYAGSATSALLHNREILDPVKADLPWLYMCHDREKRCMQIDLIRLYDSGGTEPLGNSVRLSGKDYHVVANSERVEPGFVGLTVAVPLSQYTDPATRKKPSPNYELYRVIRLKDNATYLDEELSIHALPGTVDAAPCFAVRYFAHINAGWEGLSLLNSGVAQAFATGVGWGAHSSYGFGCSACIEDLQLDSANVWASVSPCKSLKCRHVFARVEEWYEEVSRDEGLRRALQTASLQTSAHRAAHAGSGS